MKGHVLGGSLCGASPAAKGLYWLVKLQWSQRGQAGNKPYGPTQVCAWMLLLKIQIFQVAVGVLRVVIQSPGGPRMSGEFGLPVGVECLKYSTGGLAGGFF